MKGIRTLAACALGLLGQAAMAATLNNGNAQLTILDTIFSNNNGNGSLLTDNPGQPDQLFQHTWYYRTPNNNQNTHFSEIFSPDFGSVVTSGNYLRGLWTNIGSGVVGQERFDAKIEMTLNDDLDTPNSVAIASVMTVRSRPENTGARTFNFFSLMDLDLAATINDSGSVLNNTDIRTNQTDAGGSFSQALGVGASRYQISTGTTLRTLLNSGSGNLATGAGANSPGTANTDTAVAFQWTVTLNPGESFSMRSYYTINGAVPEPSSLALLGLAALLGLRRR